MKSILTGNEAIEAYEELQGPCSLESMPRKCGYFISDDCTSTQHYDSMTVVAFDSTDGNSFEEVFSNVHFAVEWINQ